MLGNAVGTNAFVAFRKKIIDLDLAPSTSDTAHAVSDNTVGIDKAGAEERDSGQENAGRVTTRAGDESGILDLGSVDLGKTINSFFQEVGSGVFVSVKLLINRGIFNAKVGTKINDFTAKVDQGNGVFRGDAMGESEKNEVRRFGDEFRVGFSEAKGFGARIVAKPGEDLGEGLARVLAGGNRSKVCEGMAQEEVNQFFPRVARGPDDSNFDLSHLKK
jgi:hypothetical protein